MEIVHIAAEFAPLAKVGGLADVLLGLTRALVKEGHQVEVLLPKYDCIDYGVLDSLQIFIRDFPSYFDGQICQNTLWRASYQGISLLLIEPHTVHRYFERGAIYSHDDLDRFLYFCQVAVSYLAKRERLPHAIHLHDWHASPMAPLLKEHALLHRERVILTLHNLSYQGWTDGVPLSKIPLSQEAQEAMRDPHREGLFNLLRGGITYADCVTTVSPTYAEEILQPEMGMGLEDLLQAEPSKLVGVLNGIDTTYWNPRSDIHLPVHFSSDSFSTRAHSPFIPEKGTLKELLCEKLFLEERSGPLVGCITRLVSQKGPELIRHALRYTMRHDGLFVLLGSLSDPEVGEEFCRLKEELLGERAVHIELSYNAPLSHLVYAASDLFLVPSLFEPCGLTQMIALRYGALPLVRRTGGLKDTVHEGENGFCFEAPTASALKGALDRAFLLWRESPSVWREMMQRGMGQDFSWKHSIREYLRLYLQPQPIGR